MAKSSVPVKSIKHNFRNIILGLIVFLLLLAAYFLWAFLPGSTKKIESIADQFKPESSWTLMDNVTHPQYNVCLDSQCDDIYKRWSSSTPVTSEIFAAAITRSNWNNKLLMKKECSRDNANQSGAGYLQCKAEGRINDYQVILRSVSSYSNSNGSDIILTIEG